MKITILTYGSRGDIQPFLPLSVGLMARGHHVTLAAPARFQSLVEEHGIRFAPLPGEPEQLSRQMNDAGNNFLKMVGGLMNHALDIAVEVMRQTENACRNADLILHTFAHAVGAHTLAREMNIPDVHIQTFPMFTPTGDYPNVTLPEFKSRFLNRLTHILSQKITWWGSRAGYEYVRCRAGLPKRKLYFPFESDPSRPQTPILCAWSPSLIPPSADWPPYVCVTGWYFFETDQEYTPPADLEKFLDDGPPPVCVSFGSMVHRDAERIDRVVGEALRQTNSRGIILSGWGQIEHPSTDEVLYLQAAPHGWLLPRCSMVIHHGGAGTTSAGLRAGIPNIVIPFTADQPFWGRRVHKVGAGPEPIPVKRLSTAMLAQALLEASSEAYRERARLIAHKIHSEHGVAQAVNFLENFSNEFHTLRL